MFSTIAFFVIASAAIALVFAARAVRAAEPPRIAAADLQDESRFSALIDKFLKADAQARQILNRSNQDLYSQGYRPLLGIPHDPEKHGEAFPDLQRYFTRKLLLDLKSVQPFGETGFRELVDQIGHAADQTIECAGEIVMKYELNVQGRFNFQAELTKVPEGPEREKLKRCWLNDAILGTEIRILSWIYQELFGHPYVLPEDRGAA